MASGIVEIRSRKRNSMSLSRVVYSDGGASGNPVFKRQSLERTVEGAPSQEERRGECARDTSSF
jgi:hypothetical protein